MNWFDKLLCKLFPFRVILTPDNKRPYLIRWFVYPRVYGRWEDATADMWCIHKACASDGDREPHDHPGSFWSLPIWRGYMNQVWRIMTLDGKPVKRLGPFWRRMWPGLPQFFPTDHIHRLKLFTRELQSPERGEFREEELPAYTFVRLMKPTQPWGFIMEDGTKVPWRPYLKVERPNDARNVTGEEL